MTYPPGCSDPTADNYYPANPNNGETCIYAPTLYCPDSNADNYLGAEASALPAGSAALILPAVELPAARTVPAVGRGLACRAGISCLSSF